METEEKIACACGCGKTLNLYNKWGYRREFIHGHNKPWLGKKRSEETKLKLRLAHLGGKLISAETRKKMKENARSWTRGQKIDLSKYPNFGMLGKKHSEETKQKIREDNLKYPRRYWQEKTFSEEHRRKLRESHLGNKLSDEAREKISGPNNPGWRGGISFGDHGYRFNNKIKTQVKERDKYQCQNRGESIGYLHVHHIDYDKKNNDMRNLICLCNSCHSISNSNRQFWLKFFQNKIEKIYA